MTLREPRFPFQYRAVLFPPISSHRCIYDSPLFGSFPFFAFIIDTSADEQIASLLTEARQCTLEAEASSSFIRESINPSLPEIVNTPNPIYQVISSASWIFVQALHSRSPKLIFSSPLLDSCLETITKNLNATRSAEFVSYF
jgi:hypothetical protein